MLRSPVRLFAPLRSPCGLMTGRREGLYYHITRRINAPAREESMSNWRMAAAALAALALAPPAQAATKVRVGQPQAGTFQFVPLQVGIEAGIFKRHGIEVELSSFSGGPRVQQAIAADSIDIGLGSGPELALAAKGAPE